MSNTFQQNVFAVKYVTFLLRGLLNGFCNNFMHLIIIKKNMTMNARKVVLLKLFLFEAEFIAVFKN